MKRWYDEKNGCWMCNSDCCDEVLWDIWAIGYDYDGCKTVEDLKSLIDELIELAQKARVYLWEDKLFGVHGAPSAKNYRVPSKEEWIHQYGTNKQISGYEKRNNKNDDSRTS